MSIAHTIGRFAGQSAAYAWEGTRLASTQLAQGAKEGYQERAEALRAQRLALAPAPRPAQRKLATAK